MASTRRLAAILAADVAGYSRLMGADEEGTLAALKTIRQELSDPKVKEHRGRIVKTTGDGLLVEFASVLDAVRCAVEVQQGMAARNAEVPEERRIEFRIGINLGDVIRDGRDIFGDGVNVAARLEALAEPGGICVSRVVRDQVRDRLDYTFEDMGERQVKNIARPLRVYTLRREAVANLSTISSPPTTSSSSPIAAPRLSIVVLPLANLSNDPEQQYFADGITEDLTTDLSRIAHSFVISRNTAFTYRNKPIDTKQIGRELGVRYVLEGSVRRSGNQVRVNAQLIDADTDAHLWAERFDGDIGDLFVLQNEITSRIAIALNLELLAAEAARPTDRPDARDYILRARAAYLHGPRRDNYAEIIENLERALTLDPQSIEAQGRLAAELAGRVLDGLTATAATDIARAERLTVQALTIDPRSPLAHFARGQLLRAQRRPAEAIAEYETVIASDRNHVNALAATSWCLAYTGSLEPAIAVLLQVVRLSPRDPEIGVWFGRIGLIHLLQSRFDEAVLWLERARNANPELPYLHRHLASAYALTGEIDRAAAELSEARTLRGEGYSSISQMKAVGYFGVPTVNDLYEATFFAGLRKAGVPEE